MDDKLNKIHQYLSSQNIENLPTDYNEFVSLMQNDTKAQKIHQYLLSQNIKNVDKDFNVFRDYVGIKKKDFPEDGSTIIGPLGKESEINPSPSLTQPQPSPSGEEKPPLDLQALKPQESPFEEGYRVLMDKIIAGTPSNTDAIITGENYLTALPQEFNKRFGEAIRNVGEMLSLPRNTLSYYIDKYGGKSKKTSDSFIKTAFENIPIVKQGQVLGQLLRKENFNSIADFIENAGNPKQIPPDIGGSVLSQFGSVAFDIATVRAPHVSKLNALAKYGMERVPMFPTYLGVMGGTTKAREGGGIGEVALATGEGVAHGLTWEGMGVTAGRIGDLAKKLGAGKVTSAATRALANSVLFEGDTRLKGGEKWTGAITGALFSTPDIGKEAINQSIARRAYVSYLTTTDNAIKTIARMNIDPFTEREKSDKLWAEIEKETDPVRKQELVDEKTTIDNIINVNAITKTIIENPQPFITQIKNDPRLSEKEKTQWIDKIGNTVRDADPRIIEAQPIVNKINELQENLKGVSDLYQDPLIRQEKINFINEQIKEQRNILVETLNKPLQPQSSYKMGNKDLTRESVLKLIKEAEKPEDLEGLRVENDPVVEKQITSKFGLRVPVELALGDKSFTTKEELFKYLDEKAYDEEKNIINTSWMSQEEVGLPNDETIKAITEWTEKTKAKIKKLGGQDNAISTGESAEKSSEQAQGLESGEEERLRVWDNEKERLEAEQREEIKPVQETKPFTEREQEQKVEQPIENVEITPKEAISEEMTPKVEEVPPKPPEVTETTGMGDLKRSGFEERSIERRKEVDEVGKVVADIVDKNPHFYEEMHQKDKIEEAKTYIAEKGIDEAYADLITKTKDFEQLPVRHVARQILMQHYGNKLAELNKIADKKGADAIADKIIELEDRLQKEVRIAGQTGAMTMWKILNPQASVFMAEKLIRDVNKQKLGFEEEGAKDFLDKWNEEVPTVVKQLLTENKEFKDAIDKLEARVKELEARGGKNIPRVPKERAKEIASKVRSLKSTNWGLSFADPVGAVAILDGALELTAKTIETTGNVLQALNDGIRYIKSTDWYKKLTDANKKEVESKYRDRIRGEFDFDAEEYITGTSWYRKETTGISEPTKETQAKKTFNKAKKEADERLKDQIYDIVASHLLVDKGKGENLADKFEKELGLTKSEAKKISEIAERAFETGAQKIFDKTLSPKIPKTSKKKTAFDKFFGLIKRGVLNSDNYYELFADKYGLRKKLTPEEKRELTRLGINAEKMQPYGYFGDLATNEFLQYMSKLSDMDNWATRQTKLMVAANYARMLSGITTQWINISTGGVNLLVRPFAQAINIGKWMDTVKALAKGDKLGVRLNNPLIDLYYAYGIPFIKGTRGAYGAGARIGFNQAKNIVQKGDVKTASKYMESVNNQAGQNVPELEKNKYGVGKRFKPLMVGGADLNVFNLMKYSGRMLLAEDAQMMNMPFALELALAARKESLRGGTKLSGKELRTKIINEIQGTFLTEEQAREVDSQVNDQVQKLRDAGIEPTESQIKQRRFEITRSLLDLNKDVVDEATQLARGDIFTDVRGGIFSQFSDAVSRIVNKNIVNKVLTMPKIPFTSVVGRIADMTMDSLYGAVRAKGWSPTGIIARMRQWHTTGQASDFLVPPAHYGAFRSAQLGETGTARYEQQMRRQYVGLLTLGVLSSLFLRDDPEDGSEPFLDITGELAFADAEKKLRHPMGAYTIKIGNRKFRYINYPIINGFMSLIGNYKDHLRAGVPHEELNAKLGLAAHSFLHTLTLIKDTSLAKGVNDLLKLMTGALNSFSTKEGKEILKEGGVGEQVTLDPEVIKQLETMRDDYSGIVTRYVLPWKSNLVQQIWKGVTPESRLKGTAEQLLMYNLGLQNISNDKKTDIFGETMESMPGEMGIAWPRKENDRWKKLWDYNINLKDITPYDKKVIAGKYQQLEWDQFLSRKKQANELFKKRFDDYFKKITPEEIRVKEETFTIDPTSKKKTNQLHEDVNKIWLQTKSDIDKLMFVWDEQAKQNPELFNKLKETSALPDFFNDKQEIGGKKIVVPFDMLEKVNKEAMDLFIKQVDGLMKSEKFLLLADIPYKPDKSLPPELQIQDKSELQVKIKEQWEKALKPAKKKMLRELEQIYGKTNK